MTSNMKILAVLTMGLLSTGLPSSAQDISDNGIPGTIAVRPANDSNGKILNMEETILSRELSPAGVNCFWSEDHVLQRRMNDGKIMTIDFLNGGIETESEVQTNPSDNLPKRIKKCRNIVRSPQGKDSEILYAFTVRNNLYICDSTGRTDTVTAEKKLRPSAFAAVRGLPSLKKSQGSATHS